MTNLEFKDMVKNYKTLSQMDKYILRAGWKPRLYGIHSQAKLEDAGVSVIRHYVLHNIDLAKAMIKEEIECIRILSKRIKLI